MELINLDHISANPVLPEVKDAMIDAMKNNFGNPSSQHRLGEGARLSRNADDGRGMQRFDGGQEIG